MAGAFKTSATVWMPRTGHSAARAFQWLWNAHERCKRGPQPSTVNVVDMLINIYTLTMPSLLLSAKCECT